MAAAMSGQRIAPWPVQPPPSHRAHRARDETGHRGAPGLGLRHGSGAWSVPRSAFESRRRSRDRTLAPGPMSGGPASATEWGDVLEDMKQQIRDLTNLTTTQAQATARLEDRLGEYGNKIRTGQQD